MMNPICSRKLSYVEALRIAYNEKQWEEHTDAEMQLEFVRAVIEGL